LGGGSGDAGSRLGGSSLFDADTSAIAAAPHSSSRHGSLFESGRNNTTTSLFDDTAASFFDRSGRGSIFDNERSLFAANSEQSGVSR
jgi:hypothetical protein